MKTAAIVNAVLRPLTGLIVLPKKLMAQKRKVWIAALLAASTLVSCSDNEPWKQTSATSEIQKIETQYKQGMNKQEGVITGRKRETSMRPDRVEQLYMNISMQAREYVDDKKVYSSSGRIDFDGYDVGVIPVRGACPVEFEEIRIHMDCEDSDPATKIVKSGGQYADQDGIIVDGNKNVTFVFCRVDGRKFKPFAQQHGGNVAFGVLQLGSKLPGVIGGIHFLERFFDNEDSGNGNTTSGDIGPLNAA